MIGSLLKKFSGNHYRRFVKKAQPLVAKINAIESTYQQLSDDELRAKTDEFRERYQKGESIDDLLPEAFAAGKNAARRLCGKTIMVCDHELEWNMVHYDVQLIGGMALHNNKIAEMATGEGKTLVATLPLYLNAITGRNCQLVTVNDYLARRDSEWMGYLYNYLGVTVACIQNGMQADERRHAYSQNITYGTSSEFGFDYLRDNGMATRKEDQVQSDYYYCIVDEIDSILIDEARTPLIISGPVQETREAPFSELKPDVQRLVATQQKYCNQLADEARKELDKEDGDRELAIQKLLQVRKGMPKNKQLLRLMERNDVRKELEKYETEMSSDFRKTEFYHIKEELYYVIDEKQHQADLTEKGRLAVSPNQPDAFMLPDLPTHFMEIDKQAGLSDEEKQKAKQEAEDDFVQRSEQIHCLSQLLRAYSLYDRDVEYVVQEGKVMIVDENTGRLMAGRRWSDGLHQAVEAKENVAIEKESKTYATITVQNYFRLYEKLAGMTGTAETEAGEFHEIYKLEVMVIPTNKPCIRVDKNDVIFKTRREKYNAVLDSIKEANAKGQPVLVGTASVDSSELLSRMLRRSKIAHSVLNAKYHEQEAEIVSRAGERGAVTIATNMAGRGTDIKLGNGVPEAGGLLVLGTERHESRRVDRQLRGRCSRQGDPGESRFFISLEDNLMRLFANAGPITRILEKTFQEGEELEHPMLNRSIESAQKKVEQQHFSMRKRLLQYDDVLNRQREVIYGIRNDAIHSDSPRDIIDEMLEEEIESRIESLLPDFAPDVSDEDLEAFLSWLNSHFPVAIAPDALREQRADTLHAFVVARVKEAYDRKLEFEVPEAVADLERYVIISAIDQHWQDHLTEMEELRRSVGLRGYGQKDPLNEYKSEAFVYFEEMMGRVRNAICIGLFRSSTNLEAFQNMLSVLSGQAHATGPNNQDADASSGDAAKENKAPRITIRREVPKIGRNEMVTISKNGEEQEMKFKKAQLLIENEGWVLVPRK